MKILTFIPTALMALGLMFPAHAHATPATWTIIKGEQESRIAFEATQMGAPFEGHFRDFTGTIQFDAADLGNSRADIEIDMASVDAGSTDRNKYLPMADWFNTASFPHARFVTTSIEKGLDTNQYVAKGNLTLRDVTLPVILPFTLKETTAQENGQPVVTAVMEGQTSINRVQFGVGQGQWSDVKTVGGDIQVKIHLTAKKQ